MDPNIISAASRKRSLTDFTGSYHGSYRSPEQRFIHKLYDTDKGHLPISNHNPEMLYNATYTSLGQETERAIIIQEYVNLRFGNNEDFEKNQVSTLARITEMCKVSQRISKWVMIEGQAGAHKEKII